MTLEESRIFRNWFVDRLKKGIYEETYLLGFDFDKILFGKGIIIDYNYEDLYPEKEPLIYSIKYLDCYNEFYNDIIIPLNRDKKLKKILGL